MVEGKLESGTGGVRWLELDCLREDRERDVAGVLFGMRDVSEDVGLELEVGSELEVVCRRDVEEDVGSVAELDELVPLGSQPGIDPKSMSESRMVSRPPLVMELRSEKSGISCSLWSEVCGASWL